MMRMMRMMMTMRTADFRGMDWRRKEGEEERVSDAGRCFFKTRTQHYKMVWKDPRDLSGIQEVPRHSTHA
eukprot:9464925-Pyramimonas_sp.AAC.1